MSLYSHSCAERQTYTMVSSFTAVTKGGSYVYVGSGGPPMAVEVLTKGASTGPTTT